MSAQRPKLEALQIIAAERQNQEDAKTAGKFKYTLNDPQMTDLERLACLGEEMGEVSTEMIKNDRPDLLMVELSQVAAVSAAWIEYLLEHGFDDPDDVIEED